MENWDARLRVETYRREEQLEEARQYRQLHANDAYHPHLLRAHERAMVWLGNRLVVWGRGLKSRYEPSAIPDGAMQAPSMRGARL